MAKNFVLLRAGCPQTPSRAEFLLTEAMDQPHSQRFYRQIGQSDPAAFHVLIQDGAGFHLRDGDTNLPDNVRIITLPPYSPELNPIEGLWDQVKDGLCNKVFDTLAELEVVLRDELQRFWRNTCRVRSLVFNWLLAQVNNSSPTVILHY